MLLRSAACKHITLNPGNLLVVCEQYFVSKWLGEFLK